MNRERLYLFDTTLRDGAQTTGVDFSTEDKRRIARLLDGLGIDYVEGGYPGANPVDDLFFAADPGFAHATFTAFGMTRRAGRSASNDPGLQAVLQSKARAVCLVAKAWDYHVRVALGATNEENLVGISDSVTAILASGRTEALIDCEHFFDGYKANPAYALSVAETAYKAGARWVVLCDTNGGTLPEEIEAIVRDLVRFVPGTHVGIHAHNDTEHAVANSLAAVRAGARQIQGTLNGLGERCGNANLTSLIPTLLLKSPYTEQFEIGVTRDKLGSVTHASRALDELLAWPSNRFAPYVGESAFATKAGIHASAIAKEPETYEHVRPESVGNQRRVLVAEQAGKSNVIAELSAIGIDIAPTDPRIGTLLDVVKARSAEGYGYDRAPASFELLARRHLGQFTPEFVVEDFRVIVRKRHRDGDPQGLEPAVLSTEGTLRVSVRGAAPVMKVADGNGPINALDTALREALQDAFGAILDRIELVDYRVRIIQRSEGSAAFSPRPTDMTDDGTGAVTRVTIESRDTLTNETWLTVGVSENIVQASFEALVDGMLYRLMRAKLNAPST